MAAPSPARAALMRSVRREHTVPELAVRKGLHALGYRFRLHDPKLPGKPDIVLPKYRTVVFVHGCFWHGHHCDHGRQPSKTNTAFWVQKIHSNKQRDVRKQKDLRRAGWNVLTVWECEVKSGLAVPKLAAALLRKARTQLMQSGAKREQT